MADFTHVLTAENLARALRIGAPDLNILMVWPHQVGERIFMRNIEASFKKSNTVKSFDVGGETTVDTEIFPSISTPTPR